MNRPVGRVLVIGGGIAGMSAAISLRSQGIEVDLLEIDAAWRPDGAGISINGAMFRALLTLGLYEDFLCEGNVGNGTVVHSADGHVLTTTSTPSAKGAGGIPGIGGITRSALTRIMAEKTKASGARVFLGQTYREIRESAEWVDVVMADGRTERYDLVVVSDGLYSKTRDVLFPYAPKPQYVGQAVWRAILPRPVGIDTTNIWLGVKGVKPGINPISKTEVYMFLSEEVSAKEFVDPKTFVARFQELLKPFACPIVRTLRGQLSGASQIVYRPMERLLMREPWFRGRVVMIGDTVHGTTPQLTAGAMMGIEDGIVLAEELERGGSVDTVLKRFFVRRFDRCRMVVENSARLGSLEISGGSEDEYAQIMRDSAAALAEPS